MQFIALQGTYSSLEFGLFSADKIISIVHYDELRASSNLVPFLESFLSKNGVTLQGLVFMAVDKGPGAFTSLRATIASINGVAFAAGIPLIGINSLEALQAQAQGVVAKEARYIAVLLNAYNNDAYFRIFDRVRDCLVDESCQKIDELVERLVGLGESILCVGNGAILYKQQLEEGLGNAVHLLPNNPAVPSVKFIGQLAFKQWQHDSQMYRSAAIEPYYLKTQLFAIKR